MSLSANNLSCIRGEHTLFSDLSFEVTQGECLHVVGANGSGKSSLLRILCGLRQADAGEVYWQARRIKGNTAFQSQRAFIGHTDALKGELTAIENLRWYQSLDQAVDEPRLDECLNQLGILRCADLPAHQMSFGQRRRLAFARLLLRNFRLWILDEPFTGIDAAGRTVVEQLCVAHLQQGNSIVMTHHQSLKQGPLSDFHSELSLSQ